MYSQACAILFWENTPFSRRKDFCEVRSRFPLAEKPAIAHGKYIFQKQLLKFIFQGVESACLSLIQFFSQGTFGVELKCTKLRYRFFCLFELEIRSLEEFVRGGLGIICVKLEIEFYPPFAESNIHIIFHECTA